MKKLFLLALPLLTVLFVFAKCEKDDEQLVDLPQAATDYIAQNYAGYEVDESEKDSLCTGTLVFDVELEKGKSEVELTFDTEGNYLFSESEIKTGDLPQAVKDGVSANYAGYSTKEAERLDMADGSKRYETELKNGSVTKEVLFAADGSVVCEAIENDDDDE